MIVLFLASLLLRFMHVMRTFCVILSLKAKLSGIICKSIFNVSEHQVENQKHDTEFRNEEAYTTGFTLVTTYEFCTVPGCYYFILYHCHWQ